MFEIMQIFLILITLIVLQNVNSQTIVWDDYRDMCVFNRNPTRDRNRCEKSVNIMVEKRMFRDDEPFWCVAIDNVKSVYNEVEFVFSGLQSTRKTDYGQTFTSSIVYTSGDEHTEIYNITTASLATFTFYPSKNYYGLQNITSIKLNGEEMCRPKNDSERDEIYPNHPNRSGIRFFKKCRWIDNRLHRPPNRCELLNQIIFEEMSLNGDELFYCIIVDRAKSLFPFNGTINLNIQFANDNYLAMWTSKNRRDPQSSRTNSTFRIVSDVFYLAIGPLRTNISDPFTNVLSIKLNNRESCRLRINPNEKHVTCGMRMINHQGLITFGGEVYHGKYPWHAALYELKNSGQQLFICGGNIISSTVILTAAHCIQNSHGVKTPEILRVQLGKHDLSIFNAETKEYRVREVIPHYDFDFNYLENDIAILKLENFVIFSNYIQPICLSGQKDGDLFVNRVGYVPGWGKNEMQIQNAELHDASMPIIPHQDCRRSKRSFFQSFLNERNFCAGFRNGTSVCDGDSGGGLVFKLETGWHLKGIVSLGVATPNKRCDLVEYVLFTDVNKYFDWIYNNIITLVN